MKIFKTLTLGILLASLAGSLTTSFSADADSKAKPYPLDKCVVSDEKLGEMGKPFVMEYKGQEIKLCCKSCLKDFNKSPAKYVKKIEQEEAKAAKAKAKDKS